MLEQKLTLHVGADFVSAFAMSAFVALKEKELPFDIVTVDLKKRDNYLPAYRDLSLTCKVPTLVHNGFALTESSAIAEYLDEAFADAGHKSVLPRGLQERARARQLQAWLRSDLLVIRQERPADLIYFGKRDQPLSDAAKAAVERLYRVAGTFLGDSDGHLFGDWSIADTDLAIMLNRLLANGDEMPEPLAAYVRRQWSRASVQAWVGQERVTPLPAS
ncbi:glutathione transferase [Pseudomonas asplenii]|uniref:Glutathione S-transferase n=1 Tax=Pseudomonas asplenii TaxID=53407 RepID=A0A1H6N7L0_9PSED|nr:glutathione transferase [Pseudomonas fuscovaginae]SEI10740.1 glutathione S-transferase [Pseudomonas fuscovaginae]